MGKISAGSYDLNKWLFGGYDTDIINVIYGGPGTGKTNFCLLAAVSRARKNGRVIFIDTEGGFSPERVRQIAGESYKDVLKNIVLLKPTNFSEQKESFHELQKQLKKQVDLIIVDGMTILYRLDLADARNKDNGDFMKVNSELTRQMKILAEIARKAEIPVLVTNQIYSWEDEKRMVAGDILKYWGKCMIELVNDKGRRSAWLRKHRSLPEKELVFQINNEGVKKRGWI
jgi:DNA repair protein RadB